MANYTIELGQLVEAGYKLPLDNYPIWDESERDTLNQMIINHYYFDEIGLETPDRFSHYLAAAMSEIMPGYNQLARLRLSDLQKELKKVTKTTPAQREKTVTEAGSEKTTEGGQDSNKSASNGYQAQSDTPQNQLTLTLTAAETAADFGGYATQIGKNVQNGNATTTYGRTSERTFNGRTTTENETVTTPGENTETQELDQVDYIARARALVINIMLDIVNDKAISSLFMNLYY